MEVKNILFVEQKLNPTGGGVQRVSNILGEEFRKRGYGVWYAFQILETDTLDIPENFKLKFNQENEEDIIFNLFKDFIEKKRIDTLIVQNVYTHKMCNIYKKLKEVYGINILCCLHANPDKYINKNCWNLTPHKIYVKDKIKEYIRFLLGDKQCSTYKEAYNLCDRYILLSDKFIPIFKNLCKIDDSSKLIGISNPLTFNPVRNNKDLKKEKRLLVVARMWEEQKRISNILMVWKHVSKEFPDWELTIVGGGPDLEKYKKTADEWNLPRIEFVGHSDEVNIYYQKASIFLMTSIWEGFSMTLIEAQINGCVPIVFDNFAAVHDIIDGSNGVIIPSNNLELYISELKKMMRDDALLNKMSEKARISSAENFNKDRIINKWNELFTEVGNENK